MSENNVFVVSVCDYEEYVPYHLWNHSYYTQEEFDNLCRKLLPQAGANVVKAESEKNKDDKSWIGGREIVEELVKLLESYDFHKFEPKEHRTYFGCITRERNREGRELESLGESAKLIDEYNGNFEKELYGKET